MVPELEKPKITEIKVRMDCNGCVQKIKKALHGINGIYDLYIDFPEQKITIIGWADPEKIVKAIKKARKTAMICSHSEVPDPPPPQPTEQPPPDQPQPDLQPPPPEVGPPPPPAEPPKDQPAPENPPTDSNPSNAANDSPSSVQPIQTTDPKDVEAVHFIYYHPSPDHGYRYGYPRFQLEPQQVTPQPIVHNYNTYKPSSPLTHMYNTYRPSPHFTEYNYVRSPPHYTYHDRPEHYGDDYSNSSNGNGSGNGNISSVFSDENPNACRII